VSLHIPRKTRSESFSYIGREGHGSLHIALSVLVLGLSIGVVFGPSGNTQAGLSTPQTANMAAVAETAADQESGAPRQAAIIPPSAMPTQNSGTARNTGTAQKPGAARNTIAARNTAKHNHVRTSPVLEAPKKLILASVTPPAKPDPEEKRSLKVRSGDTLMSIMLSAGIRRDDAHDAVSALRAVYDPRALRVGQRISLTLSDDGLQEMRLDPSVIRQIAVRRDNATSFRAFEVQRTLTRRVKFAEGVITSSLYKAAVKKKVPLSVLAELMRIYSWDVDFQREIQSGDRFEVAYERFVDDEGAVVRHGEVIYARMNLSGAEKPLYRFESRPGIVDYFDNKGRSAKRPLLRTPIDGARLSSRFGKRRHPVLGYTKMHRGVDFAAATGTPIYAAGDGVVSYRGRKGGYGKYVRIRHAGGFNTAYAHMSRFNGKVTLGTRVRQGQVIGYVGTTGRSTGPHLHYEILAGGRQVNPLTVKMPSGIKLGKKSFTKFMAKRANIDSLVANLQKETLISQR
jgi:murein DD-endopeptidase MepM/ murein hydrolase activator NlpD